MVNYTITKILDSLYKDSYFQYNRAMGILDCVKQEFYKRRVSVYEDRKCSEEGDVFE
jgi:hypothetical protein